MSLTIPAELRPHRRTAWFPKTTPGEGESASSRFGGRPWVAEGEAWPMCGHCGKPMQLFLQLRADDAPAEVRDQVGDGLIQLLYCTSTDPMCDVDCEAWFPPSDSVVARRVDPAGPGGCATGGPDRPHPAETITRWSAEDDYPHGEEMGELGVELSWAQLDALSDEGLPRAGDKLLGWPHWIQGVEYPECPICSTRMTLLFQIDSENHVPYMFGDSGCGHLSVCPAHPDQLAFGWACC